MIQKILRQLLLLLLTVGLARAGWAQGTTTSSIAGTVTDQKGEDLPGATVIAVHTPTGTQYVVPTNADGRYYIQNMRVGGPYTVKVTFVGFQDFTRNNVILTLGQTQRIDVKLGDASTQLEGVTVVGSNPRSVLNAERSGPVTNVGTEQIQRLPTIQRNLNDFLRLTPQAAPSTGGALAIGGGNYRQTNITVDGSDFNNNFGIGGNLPANGSPISLDAIEEITVNIAPFDVRQSGFVGGAVNAVTRSGSNNVQGSVYGFYRNQNYYGRSIGADALTLNNISVKQFGFRVGGPIIKDKLFFFLNAERSTEEVPGQQNFASNGASSGPGSYGSANNISRPSTQFLDMVGDYLRGTSATKSWSYDPGPYQGYNFQTENTRVLGRLDWNINDKNRFTIRYNQVNSSTPSFLSTSRTPLTNYPAATGRLSPNALHFGNSNYFTEYNFYSAAAELNSTFGRSFNTLRATYTHQYEPRSSNSAVFPFVDILDGSAARVTTAPTAATGAALGSFAAYSTPLTAFGYEPFTAGNLRDVETYSVVDFVSGTFGKHTATVGGQFDLQSTKNGFQRFATSYYTYNSWADFTSGANPVDFAITYSLLPGFEQAYPRFKTAQYALYAQDEWSLTDRFRLTLGLRAELNSYLNVREIQTHPLVAALSFTDGRRIDTGVLPQNRVLLSPRVGFNWDVKGDRTLQLRGGGGIFTGRVPTVWIVSQSGDAGLIQVTQTFSTVGVTGGTNLNQTAAQKIYSGLPGYDAANGVLPFSPDPAAHRPTEQPTPGTVIPATISATDPNFRNPQTLKFALALDAKLPFGIVGTLEGTYNKDLITAYGQNYNLVNPRKLAGNNAGQAGFSDNRDLYPATVQERFTNPLTPGGQVSYTSTGNTAFNAIVLSNGHQGYYWSATAKLEKQFSTGFQASIAYTQADARVQFDGVGDQLLNTWSGTPIVNNANDPVASYAGYVVPNRIVGALTFRKEYLGHLGTTISLIYTASNQGRFSYIYSSDFNRDGQTNDLIYIPRNRDDISLTSFNYGGNYGTLNEEQQKDLLFRYIAQDPYLSKHMGEYAERNGALLPWRNQFDLRVAQDIFVNAKTRNSLQFTLDVLNFGNLLNRNWGTVQTTQNSSLLVPTNSGTTALVAGGTQRPTFRLASYGNGPVTQTYVPALTTSSTYYMQIGLRYSFN